MTEKNRIIDALGERKLLLPALVNTALAANEQVKYLLALLQMARARADQPEEGATGLQRERVASGLDDDDLDDVIAGARREADGTYRIPQLERIIGIVMANVESMLDPVEQSATQANARELVQRYQRILLKGFDTRGDTISGDTISDMTNTSRDLGDSVHLLVLDLHEALVRLQAAIVAKAIDGARAYEIKPGERPLIKAFMRGLNETAPLKFDHPGLGTTATHSGGKLVIQNDIGTTEAHVLVVHVSGGAVTLTYTDVHLQRLLFFENLLERYDVRWNDTISRRDKSMEDGVYHLSAGRYSARNRSELEEFLSFLGSRLAFLIDWNRARKRLRSLLPKGDALRLLKWAADQNHGHMGFLKLGGDRLVCDALAFAEKGPHRFGHRLDAILGAEAAFRYMRFVLKTCSEGLLKGRPDTLIVDEVKVELLCHLRAAQHRSGREQWSFLHLLA